MARPASLLAFVVVLGCAGAEPTPAPPPAATAPATTTRVATAAPAPRRFTVRGPEASPVGFDRMARYPEPGWQVPRAIAAGPDGLLTYLASENGDDKMALFAFDVAAKQSRRLLRAQDLVPSDKKLSREEELRAERQRTRVQGITSYSWAAKAPLLVVPAGGDVFVKKGDGPVVRLTETPEPELDPKACDGGERVAFVRGSELVAVDVATKRETKLTTGAPAGVTRGQSDFNGQEEFDEPSGFWWSPRCDRIAYLEVDERGVGEVPVAGYREGAADVMQMKYPLAGKKNPAVRIGIVDLATKKTRLLTIDSPSRAGSAGHPALSGYFGRFAWSADGSALFFQILSRDQKTVVIARADAQTGAVRTFAPRTRPTWVELADVRPLDRSPRLLVADDPTGHRHLRLLDAASGAVDRVLTSGDWDVDAVLGVDEERGRVLFTASIPGPTERRVYAVPLGGGAPVELTPEHGVHHAVADRAGRFFVDVHSALDRAPKAQIRDERGAVVGELPVATDPDVAKLAPRPTKVVRLAASDGTPLYASVLEPRDHKPGDKHPAVVMVYGGPGVQTVLDQWAPRLMWQHLADRGFVVFQLDNRGSAGRGHAFEAPVNRRLGTVELADQLTGLDWLVAQGMVDPQRVGIYGHSYGGTMALTAMLRAPGRFRAAVAASPVVDWRRYDTGYTERYMGTPEDNAQGYAETDLTKVAGKLTGKLLLVHALMDENVHFQNAADLLDAFIAADKTIDLLVFPGERHGYRDPAAKRYALRRVVDYFVDNL